jgi:hypothetical protein
LTGEIQRVPKILAEYESDEQRQRRKRRNLFAELSEEERERFKELVREEAEGEDERSAEAVERAWSQVVAKAEQEREDLLERVRQVLDDSDVIQLLESMAEKEDKRLTSVESTEDDEVDEKEQFLIQSESRLQVWIPRVNGERIESVEQLEDLVRKSFPGFMEQKRYSKYIRQAELHLTLVKRFQSEELKRGDMARISKETGLNPTIIRRWLIEGANPRVYHYLTRNPLGDREERVAKILSSLNGVTDMGRLEQRLGTLFLFEVWMSSKHHSKRLERAKRFFQFLEEYAKGGILKSVAERLGIGTSTINEWFNGSQLPFYVRLAAAIPGNKPDTGKKWLPLRLNHLKNLPEQFIQIPQEIKSQEDVLDVIEQVQTLDTEEMNEYEKQFESMSKAISFFYLLGLIVSDGSFKKDTETSAKVVLYASMKYDWINDLGRGFCYALGKLGISANQMADSTKTRGDTTTRFRVWGSGASPLLMWMKKVLLGLDPSSVKKEESINARWILNMPHEWRLAFLQGLTDGDGHASIKSFNAGIATLTNHKFFNKILNTFNIYPTTERTKVRIGRFDDIVKASKLPLFKHAKGRQERLEELCKIIGLLDRSYGKVPKEQIEIIMEMHNKGMSCGEITESLWFNYGIARSRRSIEGIIKRQK